MKSKIAVFVFLCAAAAAQDSASSLFRTDTAFGLKLSVELRRDGVVRTVNPQTEFRGGDQIRLHFTTNNDGYVYALNETPSGDTKLIFPTPEAGTNNRVAKGQDYTIPSSNGWFRITGRPGVEKVVMIVSPGPLNSLDPGKTQGGPAARLEGSESTTTGGKVTTITRPVDTGSRAVAAGGTSNSTATPTDPGAATQQPEKTAASGGTSNSTTSSKKKKDTMADTRKKVNTVQGGVSLASQVESIPGNVTRLVPGLGSRDLVLEDDIQQNATFISSKPEGLSGPAIFTVALVHR